MLAFSVACLLLDRPWCYGVCARVRFNGRFAWLCVLVLSALFVLSSVQLRCRRSVSRGMLLLRTDRSIPSGSRCSLSGRGIRVTHFGIRLCCLLSLRLIVLRRIAIRAVRVSASVVCLSIDLSSGIIADGVIRTTIWSAFMRLCSRSCRTQ